MQQKKLYVIVPMDFHPFKADADTPRTLRRRSRVQGIGKSRNPSQVLATHSLLRVSCRLPITPGMLRKGFEALVDAFVFIRFSRLFARYSDEIHADLLH